MRRKKIFVNYLIILIATSTFVFVGCDVSNDNNIKVGVILPLSGSSADAANQIKDGIELAKDDLQKSFPRYEIDLIYGDSKNQAKDGLAEYNKMKSLQNIQYFIASNSGVVAPLVQTVKNDRDVILMTTVNSASGIPQSGENIYRIFVSVENEAKTMAEFIGDSLKVNNISVLYINDDFGLSGVRVFKEKLSSYNMRVLWESSYEKNGLDFSNTIFKMPPETEVVYVIGYDTAFGTIIKQLREFGYKNNIVTTIGLSVPSWSAIAGQAAENAYYTSANFSTMKPSTENKVYIKNFELKHGKLPSSFSAFGYDAASILLQGVIKSKESGKSFQEIINEINYVGTMGKVRFDKDGEADLPLSIYQFHESGGLKIK